jgi:hypothetical protein
MSNPNRGTAAPIRRAVGTSVARHHAILPALVMAAGLLAGCISPYEDARLKSLTVPPDLAIDFVVRGDPQSPDRREMQSRYVLLPDRQLHVALGDDAATEAYPRHYRILSPREMERLVQIIGEGGLPAEPSSPAAEQALAAGGTPGADVAPVTYRVWLTGWGKTNRYVTTPEESPPTGRLLDELIRLTGGISAATEPEDDEPRKPPARPAEDDPEE